MLAALATPLVLSVHSVVSFDFAVSQLPGWHTTIFPPYFVAGAVFGGFAMVVTLADSGQLRVTYTALCGDLQSERSGAGTAVMGTASSLERSDCRSPQRAV